MRPDAGLQPAFQAAYQGQMQPQQQGGRNAQVQQMRQPPLHGIDNLSRDLVASNDLQQKHCLLIFDSYLDKIKTENSWGAKVEWEEATGPAVQDILVETSSSSTRGASNMQQVPLQIQEMMPMDPNTPSHRNDQRGGPMMYPGDAPGRGLGPQGQQQGNVQNMQGNVQMMPMQMMPGRGQPAPGGQMVPPQGHGNQMGGGGQMNPGPQMGGNSPQMGNQMGGQMGNDGMGRGGDRGNRWATMAWVAE